MMCLFNFTCPFTLIKFNLISSDVNNAMLTSFYICKKIMVFTKEDTGNNKFHFSRSVVA